MVAEAAAPKTKQAAKGRARREDMLRQAQAQHDATVEPTKEVPEQASK